MSIELSDLTVEPPQPGPADWNDEGVVRLPGAIPEREMVEYGYAWARENGYAGTTWSKAGGVRVLEANRPGGWPDCTPYMRHPEILDLCAPLAGPLEELVGEPMGMHLNLTGWVTTERDWHQDSYLNEPGVGDHYAAVWVALGDIHSGSGPFQYVPSSHRWPQVTRELIGEHVNLEDPQWPKHSELVLSPLFKKEISRRHARVVTHLPHAGDALIWHGRLLHRGSRAVVPGAYRPGFIAHFSGIHSRPSMGEAVRHPAGGWYFELEGGLV